MFFSLGQKRKNQVASGNKAPNSRQFTKTIPNLRKLSQLNRQQTKELDPFDPGDPETD